MRHLILILFTCLTLPVFGQLTWREATVAEMAAGTAGQPVAVTPRRMGGALVTGSTIWVDKVNGSDSTGARGNQALASASISNAITLSHPGDLIHVRPGTYNENNLLRSNLVNFYFDEGARILYTNSNNFLPIFTDFTNTPFVYPPFPQCQGRTNNVMGHGIFTYAATYDPNNNTPSAVAYIGSTNTIFYIEGDEIVQTNWAADDGTLGVGGGGLLVDFCKYVNAHFKRIEHYDPANGNGNGKIEGYGAIEWIAGNFDCEVDTLISSNSFAIDINSPQPDPYNSSTSFMLRAQGIHNYGTGNAIWTYGGADSVPQHNQRAWIEAQEIEADAGEVYLNENGGGYKVYITAQKIHNHSSTFPLFNIINGGNSSLTWTWITAQKITDNKGGGFLVIANPFSAFGNTNMTTFIHAKQYEVVATNSATAFNLSGGQTYISGDILKIPNGSGIYMSTTGSVYVNGLTIDTSTGSSGVTNWCAFKQGGSMFLNACRFVSPAGAHALDATNSQSVTFNFSSVSTSTNMFVPTGVWFSNATLFVAGTPK